MEQTEKYSGARLVLRWLKKIGAEKLFIVSGTDYAAFIEEYAKGGEDLPELIVVPHEITAVSAAIGYSLGGKVGVVAVHTTPGTANALGGIMNSYTSRIPLIVIAGRSPYTEEGHRGSRNLRIHWTQEARDQGEMVRQWVKWDFEIRRVEQIPEVMYRAYQIMMSEPRGPVYIVIPREVSIEEGKDKDFPLSYCEPGATTEAIVKARDMINEAENPVIITWRAGRRKEWFESLTRFADKFNIPVINYVGEVVNYPSTGPMALDKIDLSKVDLAIVVEAEVPWIPKRTKFKGKIIKVDVEPLYTYIPYYGFYCDLCIQSTVSDFFDKLVKIEIKIRDKNWIIEEKRKQEELKAKEIEKLRDKKPIHPKYLSFEIGKLGLTIFNEYPFNPKYAKLDDYGSYYHDLSAGYLGWALGASVGYKLATGKDVVVTIGDGSFIFGVPEAFYYIASQSPVLVVIYDNGGWLAVQEAVEEVFPEGIASRSCGNS
ncbi:MAG: thiamine pyrophosphate-requiring protein [Sulfolobaceae archaeon]